MEKQEFTELNETIYRDQLNNGLKLIVLPKKDFHKTYAILTVDFGSIDQTFIPNGQKEFVTIPDGTAHFLEHKMFEKQDYDAFELFGNFGADANAFTSFTQTSYLFSSSNHIHENLDILLDFVEQPYFSKQTVDKEKGIIGQEISMYDDDPNWKLYFGMLKNLYPHDPMHIDIAGSADSIKTITEETLYETYRTFYQPQNMSLFIVGDVNPDEVDEWVADNQAKKEFVTYQDPQLTFELNDDEGLDVIPFRTNEMDVNRPKVMIGLRGLFQPETGKERLKYRLSVELLLDLLFDDTSENYLRLYNAEVIDDSFSYNFEMQRGFNLAYISGDTNYPERFSDEIVAILENVHTQIEGATTQFENVKRATLGRMIGALDSPEAIANRYAGNLYDNVSLLDEINSLQAITIDDLYQIADQFVNSQGISVYQITPMRNN